MILTGLLYSCREAARRLAEGGAGLSPSRRLLLRLHLVLCAPCRRFARQLELIERALRELWAAELSPAELETARERILARLRGVG